MLSHLLFKPSSYHLKATALKKYEERNNFFWILLSLFKCPVQGSDQTQQYANKESFPDK